MCLCASSIDTQRFVAHLNDALSAAWLCRVSVEVRDIENEFISESGCIYFQRLFCKLHVARTWKTARDGGECMIFVQ